MPPELPVRLSRWSWLRVAALPLLFAVMLVVAQVSELPERISPGEIRSQLREYGLWAPAALLAAYLVRPLFLLPITPLWVASGALFGWIGGALWSILGTSGGAAIGFGLARHLGRDFVQRRLGTRVRRWSRMSDDGFRTVLALQLTPIMPHDLINNLAGVSRMSYRAFALGSLLGTIPIILIYSYLGYAVLEIPSAPFWVAVGVLTAMTVTMLWWNRRIARRAGTGEPATKSEGGD